MALTPQQQATLKTFVEADPTLSTYPHTSDGADAIAKALAVTVSPAFYAWNTAVSKQAIQNAINYDRMTPAQAIPAAGNDAASTNALLAWIARSMSAQGKQFNLQNLLLSSADTIDASLSQNRAAWQDALTALPTKSDGTTWPAGWSAVQLIMSRPVNVLEKLFSTGTGTQADPATMTVQGTLSYAEVAAAMQWPI